MASSAIQLRSVLRNSAVDPSRVALMGPGFDPVTYSELYRMVDGAKSILRDHDVGPGQRIAIALPNSVSFVTWLLAIFENDNTAVPLDPQLRPAEAKLALDESCANILLSLKSEWLQAQEWQTGELQAPGPRLRISRRSQFMNAPQTAEGSILLHMTSGSNGRPKRILRTEIEIAEDCSHLQSALQLGTQDRFLALPPFHHSFGANGLYAALASGGACILPGRFLPSNVIDCARSFRPSWALVTPSMIEVLVACRSKPDDLEAFSSLRHLVCSTGKLSSQAHTEFFQRFQVKAKIQYGSTETLSATLTSDGEYAEGRVGRPYAGMEVAVFDEDGQLAPAGSIGRIGIGGPTVCSAYENSEYTLTRIERFVLPGDRGYVDDSGQLFVVGREDIFNIGGNKVARYEVEHAIQSGFDVSSVIVMPYSRAGLAALRAVIEPRSDNVTPGAVSAFCRERLSAFKVPARIDVLRSLPRDGNGKINMSSLRRLLDDLEEE